MAVALSKAEKDFLEDALPTSQDAASYAKKEHPAPDGPLFENPFQLADLLVFDDASLRDIIRKEAFGVTIHDLGLGAQQQSRPLVERLRQNMTLHQRSQFNRQLHRAVSPTQIEAARQKVLDGLFWELTYWKTPELYEELTEGEALHPGIFKRLEPDLQGKTVLDAGAGSGRASFECVRYGAKQVYAVEPSLGLLKIMGQKLAHQPIADRIVPLQGRFDKLPLGDHSVDVAISCSAFTADPEQGGLPGLNELKRVTRPGGKVVIIWPRAEDHTWLNEQGFQHVALPLKTEMKVRFRSLQSALRCARRFYARNRAVVHYLQKQRTPEVPFSVLGFNPPRDYCWLTV